MNTTTISIIVTSLIITGALWLGLSNGTSEVASTQNVSVVSGQQVVAINAKGGYMPKLTAAKANMPTTLRITTNSTFDCSASVSIQSLGIRKFLPQSGTTDLEVPAQKAGSTLQGVCAMGMYHFDVRFE